MGKIKVEGKATRDVVQDSIKFDININSKGKNSAECIKKINEETEKFLMKWKEATNSLDIKISTDDIRGPYTDDKNKQYFEGKRLLVIETKYDGKIRSLIHRIVEDNNIGASINCSYFISNEKEILKDLLTEAVANSKEQAELISVSTGQNVSSIEEVRTKNYQDEWSEDVKGTGVKDVILKNMKDESFNMLVDELMPETKTLSERVYVIWNIE